MVSLHFFVVILTLSLLQNASSSKPFFRTQMRRTLAIDYFDNCDGKEWPVTYARFSFGRNGTFLIISGEEMVSRDIKHPVSSQARIEKCKDKANPDTCEYYTTWKWDDICIFYNVFPTGKEWMNAHRPPLVCPMKKNIYYLQNYKIQADVLVPFLGTIDARALLKFRITMTEPGGDAPVTCFDLFLKAVSVRVRS